MFSAGLIIMLDRGSVEELSIFMASAVETRAGCRGTEEMGVVI
jgi:hypothetical protein